MMVQLLYTNMPDGDDRTIEGRDPRTGYQEKSTGEMMYNCTSIHSAGARQGSSTVWFPLSLPRLGACKVAAREGCWVTSMFTSQFQALEDGKKSE